MKKKDEYIPLPERAVLVEKARASRPKLILNTLTYPGFRGEPSVLPGKR